MSEFFASLLAKATFMLLEALIMHFIQSIAASIFRPAGVRLA